MSADDRRGELAPVVAAAQRVAGIVAARGRGDTDGARDLLRTFTDERELATGALLVAELSLGLLQRASGESFDECVQDLCVEMEAALR